MFKPEDFWKIFKYIYQNRNNGGGNDIEIQDNIKAIALSEYSKSNILFEETIDQIPFTSQDYRKLRSFLINWYASHRALTKIQEDSSELFFMNNENLDELFKSFGYQYSTRISSFETKVNFFLDLVNLYKIKGTPASIRRILSYYGMRNVVLTEYFLRLNDDNILMFDPKPLLDTYNDNKDLNLAPLYFSDLTKLDAHWLQTNSDIMQLINDNKISLPSKTPYFGVRPSYEFKSIDPVLTYFSRIISDNIKGFLDDGTLQERDIFVEEINFNISITELYLTCIYCFNKVYGYTPSTDDNFVINNTNITDDYDLFKQEYESIIKHTPTSREDRNQKIHEFADKFTRNLSLSYLNSQDESASLLDTMNPGLREEIDVWENAGRIIEVLPYLVNALNAWLDDNIDVSFPDFTILTLGFEGLLDIRDAIDFFKPKRSRFLALDVAYEFNNKLFDSVQFEDEVTNFDLQQDFHIYGRPDSIDCGVGHQNEKIFDCGYKFDVGLLDDSYEMEYTEEPFIDNMVSKDCGETNFDHSYYYPNDSTSELEIDDVLVTSSATNFPHFDEDDFTFDERRNCRQEIFHIEVQTI